MRKACMRGMPTLVCLLLAACGGGGGGDNGNGNGNGGGAHPTAVDYFPAPSNARWLYALGDGSTERVDVVGSESTAQGVGTTLVTTDGTGAIVDRTVAYVDGAGVTVYPTDLGGFGPAMGPLKLLAFPANAGQSFTAVDKTFTSSYDFDHDGKSDRVTAKSTVKVIGYEDIDVPAGHFANALHVRTDSTETVVLSASGTPYPVRSVVDYWYAPSVGLARSTEVDYEADGTTADPATTRSLTGYRVGQFRSEMTAPTVSTTAPGLAARASGADVSVTFSEPVDADTLASGWQVVDPDGSLLAGHVTMVGNTAHFVPDTAWANGTYTATLTTAVTDLVGNALARTSAWHFSLDAVAPTVLSSTPAAAAIDVASTAPVVIAFSEPIDPASVNAGTIYVSDGTNAIPVTTQVSGATLTITPTAGWQRQKTIEVSFGGITDVPGNAMTDSFATTFRTDAGQFDYPQDLTTAGTQAVAVVDIDGDGHDDFVYTVPATGLASAWVRYGRGDGTLAAPVPLVADDIWNCSQNGGLTVVDLDGDGRKDVLVGGGWCPWHVLRQTAARTFVLGEQANYVTAGPVQVADLDGDGQLEVVGLSTNSAELMVWHQDGTHRFTDAPTARIALPGHAGFGLHVADLDGDGRPDLLITGGGFVGEDIEVLRQQPDGSFVQAQSLSTGEGGASGLAVGDIDGDGRPDLIVTAGGNQPVYVAVFHQLADHSFDTPQRLPTLDVPAAVALADVDGDGRPDIVVTHAGWGHVGTFLGQADGTLAAESLFVTGYGSGSQVQLAVGDLTGDGRIDLVVDGQLLRQRTPDSGASAPLGLHGLARATRGLPRALHLPPAAGARQ